MNEKICVIGAGAWGENHIRTLKEMGNLGAVVDTNEKRLAEIESKYEVETFSTLDEAIARRFDGYVVSSAAETHYEIGKRILSAGLPCMIEKPMTIHSEEAKELVLLAEENNTQLMVAHILLFHPAINKIKEVIDDGMIGDLYYLYSTRIKFGVIRTEENVFWSFAPHDIAVLDYLVGSPAEKIQVHTGNFLQSNIADYAMAQLDYPNNIKAHIQVSWLHPFKEQRLVAVGSKGMLWFDDAGDKQIRFCDKHVEWNDAIPRTAETVSEIIPYDNSEMPLERELKYFIAHLNIPADRSSGQAGYDVVRVLETTQSEEKENG